MGVVRAPHHVVHADDVPQTDADRVLLEAQHDVAMEEVTRAHAVLEPVDRLTVALAIGVVHRGEDVGSPRQLKLHDGQRQGGMALEDSRKDHVAERERRIERLGRPAARVAQRLLPRPADLALPSRGGVQAERHAERRRRGPERLVLGLVVAPVLERIFRDHRAGEAEPGGPLELADAVPDIVQVDHGDALESARIAATELREPVVVGAEDRRHQRRVGHPEVEEPLRRVQHLTGHAVEPHVREVLLGIVPSPGHVLEPALSGNGLGRLEASAGVGDEADAGDDLVRLDHELVGAVDTLHAGRAIAKGRVDADRPQIGRLEHVRIGRQDQGRDHRG